MLDIGRCLLNSIPASKLSSEATESRLRIRSGCMSLYNQCRDCSAANLQLDIGNRSRLDRYSNARRVRCRVSKQRIVGVKFNIRKLPCQENLTDADRLEVKAGDKVCISTCSSTYNGLRIVSTTSLGPGANDASLIAAGLLSVVLPMLPGVFLAFDVLT